MIRTSRPGLLGHLAQRRSARGLARIGRALRQGPRHAVRFPAAAADDELRDPVLVSDDDAAGGGCGGVPQARHGADAALERRAARCAPEPAQCIARPAADAGRQWPAAARRAGRRASSRGAATSGAVAGPRRTVWRAVAGWNVPAPRRPSRRSRARDGGTDEARCRPGRVLGGDAVLHGRQSYRFRPALQASRASAPAALPVSARHARSASAISRSAERLDRASSDVRRVRAQRGQMRVERADVAARERPGQGASDARAPGRCRGSARMSGT